ncbi:MAG: 30S ribosomal protein S21 [Bacteroidetes bacterium]|nr:30S ribosomal protein S21 [Bacteroidota bacterium]MBU2585615.1 30S ribosomal protein S21 [Bacteroidota bacterium]
MVGISINETESFDRALRRFKKKYERSGVLKEYKKRTFFSKPSIKKRMKRAKAIRRMQRTVLEEMA